jgi:hypothetical protein
VKVAPKCMIGLSIESAESVCGNKSTAIFSQVAMGCTVDVVLCMQVQYCIAENSILPHTQAVVFSNHAAIYAYAMPTPIPISTVPMPMPMPMPIPLCT